MVLAQLFVPESKAGRATPVDPNGKGLLITALFSHTSLIIEGSYRGWLSFFILALALLSTTGVILFNIYERRCIHPLIDIRFFSSIPFRSATVIAICAFASLIGFSFLNALYLQHERHLSALDTGLCTLPMALMVMVSSPISGRLVATHGTRPSLLIAGLGFILSGTILAQITPDTPLLVLLTTYTVFGIGFGVVNAPIPIRQLQACRRLRQVLLQRSRRQAVRSELHSVLRSPALSSM